MPSYRTSARPAAPSLQQTAAASPTTSSSTTSDNSLSQEAMRRDRAEVDQAPADPTSAEGLRTPGAEASAEDKGARLGGVLGEAQVQLATRDRSQVLRAAPGAQSMAAMLGSALLQDEQADLDPDELCITHVSPPQAEKGDIVTVHGSGFEKRSDLVVRFTSPNVGIQPGELISKTNTTATVKVPNYAGTGPIKLLSYIRGSGEAGDPITQDPEQYQSPFDFVVPNNPTFEAFEPAQGTRRTEVEILGYNLWGTQEVAFTGGSTPLIRTAGTGTVTDQGEMAKVVVTVPDAAQSGPITVTTANGSITTPSYDIGDPDWQVAPVISEVEPTHGEPGDQVVLRGTFNPASQENDVYFSGGKATVVDGTEEVLVVVVPPGARSGSIHLENTGGSAWGPYFLLPPVVDSVTPATGPPGYQVDVRGDFGLYNQDTFKVRIGGTLVPILAGSSSKLSVEIPPSAPSGAVEVETPAGTMTAPGTFTAVQVEGQGGLQQATAQIPSTLEQERILSSASSGRASMLAQLAMATAQASQAPAEEEEAPAEEAPEEAPLDPSVLAISGANPKSAQRGEVMTIKGSGFATKTDVVVRFTRTNSITAGEVVGRSNTELRVKVPKDANSGPLQILAYNKGSGQPGDPVCQDSEVVDSAFDVWVEPSIEGFTPTASGVDIRGYNLRYPQVKLHSGVRVPANYVSNLPSYVDDPDLGEQRTLHVSLVPEEAETGPVQVLTMDGIATSETDFEIS